jgi:sugar phosphate permease
VLTRIVLWWSVFTAATGLAWNLPSLLAARALFGCGEAGAWPSVARTLSRWFPATERGTAQGIFFMGAHMGGGLTPLFVAMLVRQIGWRATFPTLATSGFIWAIVWFLWFRDEPAQHAAVSEAERSYIESGRQISTGHGSGLSARQIAASPSVWLLCLMYLTQTYGFTLYVTWLPTYLAHDKKLAGTMLSLFAGMPLLLSVVADLLGGLTTDRLTKRLGLRAGRCLVGAASLGLASVFLFAGAGAKGLVAATCIAIAAAFSNFLLGAAWGTCVDLAGGSAGVLSAAMNTSGQIGGVMSPIAFALLTKGQGSWNLPIFFTAGLYMLGALCWLFVHPELAIARICHSPKS